MDRYQYSYDGGSLFVTEECFSFEIKRISFVYATFDRRYPRYAEAWRAFSLSIKKKATSNRDGFDVDFVFAEYRHRIEPQNFIDSGSLSFREMAGPGLNLKFMYHHFLKMHWRFEAVEVQLVERMG